MKAAKYVLPRAAQQIRAVPLVLVETACAQKSALNTKLSPNGRNEGVGILEEIRERAGPPLLFPTLLFINEFSVGFIARLRFYSTAGLRALKRTYRKHCRSGEPQRTGRRRPRRPAMPFDD